MVEGRRPQSGMDKHRKSEVLCYRILLPASISNDEVNTANLSIASNIARVFDKDASFFFFSLSQ